MHDRSFTPCNHHPSPATGFSLVELSIVLVILGLLTGGVLAGQSLIRAAELRSVISDLERYYTATHNFRDRYMALPGDMHDATRFWHSAGGTGSDAACQAIASTNATCNGDGNGMVENYSTGNQVVEKTRAWQHLALAGLIEGSYQGTRSTPVLLGTEVPQSKISNAGYWFGVVPGNFYAFTPPGKHYFEFARVTVNTWPNQGAISVQEAWGIDKKMDDGLASTGNILAFDGATESTGKSDRFGECVDAPMAAISAHYIMTSEARQGCRLFFSF